MGASQWRGDRPALRAAAPTQRGLQERSYSNLPLVSRGGTELTKCFLNVLVLLKDSGLACESSSGEIVESQVYTSTIHKKKASRVSKTDVRGKVRWKCYS